MRQARTFWSIRPFWLYNSFHENAIVDHANTRLLILCQYDVRAANKWWWRIHSKFMFAAEWVTYSTVSINPSPTVINSHIRALHEVRENFLRVLARLASTIASTTPNTMPTNSCSYLSRARCVRQSSSGWTYARKHPPVLHWLTLRKEKVRTYLVQLWLLWPPQ